MVFPHESIATKAGVLIIKLWNIYILCTVLSSQLPCHTTHMAMLNVNGLTVQWWVCSHHYLRSRKITGHYTYHLWSSHTMPCHSTTGYQPYELMFGCKVPTICDAWLRLADYDDNYLQSKREWVNQQHELILAVNRHALKRIKQSAEKSVSWAGGKDFEIPMGNFGIITWSSRRLE